MSNLAAAPNLFLPPTSQSQCFYKPRFHAHLHHLELRHPTSTSAFYFGRAQVSSLQIHPGDQSLAPLAHSTRFSIPKKEDFVLYTGVNPEPVGDGIIREELQLSEHDEPEKDWVSKLKSMSAGHGRLQEFCFRFYFRWCHPPASEHHRYATERRKQVQSIVLLRLAADDGRCSKLGRNVLLEMRQLRADIGVVSRADGSASFEMGDAKVITDVFGP